MRWDGRSTDTSDEAALPGLDRLGGILRTVTPEEFPGVRFHEVIARSALNAVPAASQMPFRWTVNPYRGCTHACVYCFARGSHGWLELGTGAGFDREIVVKVNLVQRLRAELGRPGWRREHVALGTNTDPYQRAEGRYRLMPGVINALADSGTPLSLLTKGTLLRRDLPLLASVAARVPVSLAVSVAILDQRLHESLEPGTPSPRVRLDLVRAVRERGMPCGVLLAPVLPWLTDSAERLDRAFAELAAAGATSVSVIPLHLRPGAREWFLGWLSRERPELVGRYRRLYGRGSYVPVDYRTWLSGRIAELQRRYGLEPDASARGIAGPDAYGAGPGGADDTPATVRSRGGEPGGAAQRDGGARGGAAQLRLV
jgi:DNA repair photolyase